MKKTISEYTRQIHQTAQSKGWWEEWDAGATPTRAEEEIASLVYDYRRVSEMLEDCRVGKSTILGPVACSGMEPEKLRVLVKLALIHSEVSEAVEACLDERLGVEIGDGDDKPEGMVIELADVVIRILDLCDKLGFDLEAAIEAKVAYNERRPHRHGGKLA